jgi:cytochrome c
MTGWGPTRRNNWKAISNEVIWFCASSCARPMISRSPAAGSCKLVRIWLSFATSTSSRDAGKIVRNFASRKARAAIALATWSLFVPLGSSWAQPRPADTRRSHELAARLCTNCNAIDRQASSSIRADVPSFSTIANRPGATAEHLAGRIIVPHPAMPGVPLTTAEIRDIVAYIVSLRKGD